MTACRADLSFAELARQVGEACRPSRDPASLSGSDRFDDASLGIDSLAFMEIVIAIENEHGVVFEDDYVAIEAFDTLADLLDYVRNKASAA